MHYVNSHQEAAAGPWQNGRMDQADRKLRTMWTELFESVFVRGQWIRSAPRASQVAGGEFLGSSMLYVTWTNMTQASAPHSPSS
jgi:hypothetical protein